MKVLYLLASIVLLVNSTGAEPDLILHNRRIVTVDLQFSIRQALAITGDRITQVGANDAVLRLKGPQTKIVDLGGKMVLPGLD